MKARYDFGRNWSDLATRFENEHLDRACEDLRRLVGDVAGKTFLDIGCGSGLHSAAALRLGAARVRALDYDTDCVETTRAVLSRFAPEAEWSVERADILDNGSLPSGTFDIVYSWGVLHHTGDMWAAIRNAADLVGRGGRFGIAIYLKTPLCRLWTVEKRLYSSHRCLRPPAKALFVSAYMLARTLRHRDPIAFVKNYRTHRGMEFLADVDDWLGGYPYQSTSAEELETTVEKLGFRTKRRFNVTPGIGLFGAGCGEWCFERMDL
ncbi:MULTISPECIES: class I SAM-dependent methyltransferase [unclassified Mesorhizobium]|uniref:class I SAM-dependent methyltransferase n=1 Tax=unclassified Mesorhizobium TaxID=325217 RepID=UPI000F75DD70|nr:MULTISPECIES: class I SAM-dependent methyltransferase [unclassified Mesorhizobium]AZO31849.1 class I SAM-dependent methyltransferase [Mesorhizobium sp. M1B.F.Ca.ET.045.04.1.1]RWB20993.1 MAG: methyltransferase domain-containing protein [Mesorhizobium sp.]